MKGFAAGVANAVFYGAGMGLGRHRPDGQPRRGQPVLLGALRSAMRYVDLVAAAFLVLSGLYLLYYFAVVDVGGDTSSITDSVQRFQNRVSTTLAARWELIAVVLTSVVGAALVFVARRPRPVQPVHGRTDRA